MSSVKAVCVFCGSSMGERSVYATAAHDLGVEIAHHGIKLVYGGGSTGLMGIIADSVLKHAGHATGVIPSALVKHEIQHKQLSELHLVDSMHERKAMMAQLSDAFVALPGGFGTYEELFEVITWAQLGIHHKPIVLLNVDGYFDPMLTMVRHGVREGFIRTSDPNLLRVADQAKEVIPVMQETMPADFRPKWLSLDET